MKNELKPGGVREFILWTLRFRRRVQVSGNSMQPLLKAGDEVLVDPGAYRRSDPQVGEIVVARHPSRTDVRLIKRVAAVVNNRYVLKGDNPAESTDSRSFGPVSAQHILGKVTHRF